MNRTSFGVSRLAVVAVALVLAACSDDSVPTRSDEIPFDLTPALSIVDGNNGSGNGHFFWLKPFGPGKGFDGVADGSLRPTVEVCVRNTAGDGCAAGPPLASFTRDDGSDADRIKVDSKDEYFVHWRMKSYAPERDGIYRIRVLMQGEEFGHVDVVTLRQKDIKAYSANSSGDVVPISDNGTLKISFRMEEGILEEQFCDFDQDLDVQDCSAGVETAGDGIPTVIRVGSTPSGGGSVVAVVTAPDGVFTLPNGTPIENVVVTAEVELAPPSGDILTDDNQELPYFVEVNTFPDLVYIDPNGPGVTVVICQDEDELASRGIGEPLHPQLLLYKVSDSGTTRRLPTVFGSPECEDPIPAPAPSGLIGMLKLGASTVLGVVGPQPLRARRLHGGLNTTISNDISLDAPFSTFGAVLGPNAAETDAILPAFGQPGVAVPITIQVQNALGQDFKFGGDTLKVSVVTGPNAGAPVSVVDNNNGVYSASYTPTAAGIDSIQVVLVRSDGFGLGPIGGSPFGLTIAAQTIVTNTADSGPGSLRAAMTNANATPGLDTISFNIPGAGPHVITLASALPNITDATLIDATTQPGYPGTPVVEVNGGGVSAVSGTGYGFAVMSGGVTLKGLAVTSHPLAGVFVFQSANSVKLEDNYIGTDAAGSAGKGNAQAGVRFRGSYGAIKNNVISGNQNNGILLELGATGDTISDNIIGLAPNGITPLSNQWDGITIYAGVNGALIRDNVISANGHWGIDIQHSGALAPVTNTRILNNIIGLDASGAVVRMGPADLIDGPTNYGPQLRGNLFGGVRANNAPGTAIGYNGNGNVISGNTGSGVELIGPAVSPSVLVQANFIGTNPGGTAGRGNTADGVRVATDGVLVGGPLPANRNVISGNISDGVETANAANVVIEGNYVGVDASGTSAIGNGLYFGPGQGCCHTGIFVRTGGNVVRGNVVSGNWLGIRSGDISGAANLIENNLVGTNASGTGPVGNLTYGIGLFGDKSGTQVRGNLVSFNTNGIALVEGTQGAVVGGVVPGQGNTVTQNSGPGVRVGYNTLATGDFNNTIRGNAISNNGGLGIDLAGNGVTANDAGDNDVGPNALLNVPEVQAAYNGLAPGVTRLEVRLNAEPSSIYTVEFFANATCDASGSGEGAVSLAVAVAPGATDGAGQLLYSADVPVTAAGQFITATATDQSGNTSEFSACQAVQSVPANVFYWAPSAGGNGHFYQYVTGSQSWTQAATDATALNVLGASGHLVTITSASEQAFVMSIKSALALSDWRPWIGLFDGNGLGGWAWVTAEPFGYANWGGGEPNLIGTELYVEMFGSGVWNNNTDGAIAPFGFLVEYPVP